jgi:hypothetical protein
MIRVWLAGFSSVLPGLAVAIGMMFPLLYAINSKLKQESIPVDWHGVIANESQYGREEFKRKTENL